MNNIQQDFAKAFTDGALKTFKDLCNVDIIPETVHSESDCPEMLVISGLIGITGSKFKGLMNIAFSEIGFLDTMERMIGEKHETISKEIQDGASEFANIIFGQAKKSLNENNHHIKMALPSVIRGEDLNTPEDPNIITRQLLRLPNGIAFLEVSGMELEPSTETATEKPAENTIPKLDGQVLMSFVDAVKQAFSVQCSINPSALQPFKRTPDNGYHFDVGSIIGITGASFRGTLSIAFEEKAYLELYYRMTNERHDLITPEISDAASELINIIYGVTKAKLNEQGHRLQVAMPKLIYGAHMKLSHNSSKPSIALPFDVPNGKMWVEFAFDDHQV